MFYENQPAIQLILGSPIANPRSLAPPPHSSPPTAAAAPGALLVARLSPPPQLLAPLLAAASAWAPQGVGYGHGAQALVKFPSGEALLVAAILEAPVELVARSAHSTLYRAAMRIGEVAVLLRFVHAGYAVGADEAYAAAALIGAFNHSNLVPLRAVYVGPRGEKLLVHPFDAAAPPARSIASCKVWNKVHGRVSIYHDQKKGLSKYNKAAN